MAELLDLPAGPDPDVRARPALLPDGRLPSPRWHWVARAALWLLPLTAVSRAVTPGPTYLFGSDLVNPYGIEALAGVTWLTDTLPGLAAVGLTIAAAVSLVVPAFSEARSLAYLPLGLVGKRGRRSISSMG